MGGLHGWLAWCAACQPRGRPTLQPSCANCVNQPRPPPCPADEFFDRTASFARTSQLNAYLKKRAAKAGVNLLSGKNSTGT